MVIQCGANIEMSFFDVLQLLVGVSIERDKGIDFEKMGARLVWLARMVGNVLLAAWEYFLGEVWDRELINLVAWILDEGKNNCVDLALGWRL
jgi:hypothetical protein